MKLKRFLTGVLSAVMALSVCALPAAAAEGEDTTPTAPSTSTIDTGKKGSITIHKYLMKGTLPTEDINHGEEIDADKLPKDGKDAPEAAEDVGFTLYKVMDADELVKYYDGVYAHEVTVNNYSKSNTKEIDLNQVKKDANNQPIIINPADNNQKLTNKKGEVKFGNLDIGLYVVVETKKPAAVTEAVTPFLVSVPMTKVGENGNADPTQWLYDIHVYPKNSTQVGTIYLNKKGLVGGDKINTSTDLNGVQFKLERLKDGKAVESAAAADWKIVTSENHSDGIYTTGTVGNLIGTIQVDGLHPGTYRFTEVGYADSAADVDKKYILDTAASYTFKIEAGNNGTQTVTPLDTDNKDYTIDGTIITVTNYAPDVDKQVKNRTDGKYQEASDYAVGDTISYKVAVTVPKNITKLRTFFLTDKPENMEDDSNSVKVFSDENCTTDITSAVTASTDGITVTSDKGFKVTFVPQNLVNYAGKTIYITYNAKLTKSADTTTTGNLNTIDLTYSNKIKSDTEPEDETNDCNHIEDTAVVYTFQIDITKVGKDGNNETKLDGVTFKLYEQIEHQETPANDVLSDTNAKALGFADTTNFSYKEVATDTTKGGGKLTFTGLSNSKTATTGASRYWLVETQTKEGYNLLGAPVEAKLDIVYKTTWKEENTFDKGVLVKHKHTSSTEDFKMATDGAQTNGGTQEGTKVTEGRDQGVYGSLRTEIINKKGFQLPVTGGFGTLLFSGIGVLLVLAGVAVLFSMKKKNDRA